MGNSFKLFGNAAINFVLGSVGDLGRGYLKEVQLSAQSHGTIGSASSGESILLPTDRTYPSGAGHIHFEVSFHEITSCTEVDAGEILFNETTNGSLSQRESGVIESLCGHSPSRACQVSGKKASRFEKPIDLIRGAASNSGYSLAIIISDMPNACESQDDTYAR